MDNQHRQIKGYRELSQDEIDLMNEVKTKGAEFGELLAKIAALDVDKRWLAIGQTQMQQGLMAVTRAITKPDFF
jgi:hypothetical protein